MQMRFTFRPTTSINLSYSITGSITNCHKYILRVKLDYLCLRRFFVIYHHKVNVSFKCMNMHIIYFALLPQDERAMI